MKKNRKVYIFKDIKNKRWTIYDFESKKHIGYRSSIALENCEFLVISEKRQRVLSTGKRFPHAWIIGEISSNPKLENKQVTYNPFKDNSFKCEGKTIKKSNSVLFKRNGQVLV